MGQVNFGSVPGFTSWNLSGFNFMNCCADGTAWGSPNAGRFVSVSAFWAGNGQNVNGQNGLWNGGSLVAYTGTYTAGGGSLSAGAQAWQTAGMAGTFWTNSGTTYYIGFGRDHNGSSVFSVGGGGNFACSTNTGGYLTGGVPASSCPLGGGCAHMGAYATIQALEVFVWRTGAWREAFVYVWRSGAWRQPGVYVRRSGGWNPVQRLIETAPADDRFFGVNADIKAEERDVAVWVDGEWLPGLLRLDPSNTFTIGTWDPKTDTVAGTMMGRAHPYDLSTGLGGPTKPWDIRVEGAPTKRPYVARSCEGCHELYPWERAAMREKGILSG